MLNSLDEIKTVLNLYHQDIREKYKVTEIGIFGSFVRGEQKKRSDIDILVEFKKEDVPDLFKLIEFEPLAKVYLEN